MKEIARDAIYKKENCVDFHTYSKEKLLCFKGVDSDTYNMACLSKVGSIIKRIMWQNFER